MSNEVRSVDAPSAVFHDLRVTSRKGQEIGLLQLEVLQAFGLPKLDQFGETDAYCFAVCGSYAFRTCVIPNVSSPSWTFNARRACIFPIFQAYARLYVGLFDDDGDGDRDDFAGRVVLDVARLRPNSLYDVTLPLRQSAHVYCKRPRGAIRLRFKVQYYSERRMVLSYLPTQLPKVTEPDTSVTVRCCDRKAFQNVALTVHGTHMPGRFSMKMVKALIREVNFTQVHILRYLREREMRNLITWRYPIISGFCFLAWMHSVYANTIGYVPGHIVAYLLLHLWKNYATYAMDAPLHQGFVPPTWEELFAALVWGGDAAVSNRPCIQPLQFTALPKRSPMDLIHGPAVSTTISTMEQPIGETPLDNLYEIANAFTRGVLTKKRRGRLTFHGADATLFLMGAGFAETREEAAHLACLLQRKLHLFESERKKQAFKDDANMRYYLMPYKRPKFHSRTHKPWGRLFFRLIGFTPENPSFEMDQMNFPFGGGVDHPRISVQQALCLRPKETKKQRRLLKSLSLGSSDSGNWSHFSLSKELEMHEDDSVGSVGESTGDSSGESGPSGDSGDGLSTFSMSSHGEIGGPVGKSAMTLVKLQSSVNQDINFKSKSDKPIGDVLESVRDLVHKHMLHAFNVKTYVVKRVSATDAAALPSKPKRRGLSRLRGAIRMTARLKNKSSFHGEIAAESAHGQVATSLHDGSAHGRYQNKTKLTDLDGLPADSGHSLQSVSFHNDSANIRQTSGLWEDSVDDVAIPTASTSSLECTENTKNEYEKMLKIGASSNSNPWVSKVGVLVQPLVESALGVLGMVRAFFNLFTWRDPLLSFWVSSIGTVIMVVFYIFPWRIVLGAVGLFVLGPQNWLLRVLRERGGIEAINPDIALHRTKPKLIIQNVHEEPLFSSKAHQNDCTDYSTIKGDSVRHVVVPHTPLLFNHRFYDWPPEPQFSEVKPDYLPIARVSEVPVINTVSLHDRSSEDIREVRQIYSWIPRRKKKRD